MFSVAQCFFFFFFLSGATGHLDSLNDYKYVDATDYKYVETSK